VEGSVSRNDEVLPATSWVGMAVVAVLIPAFVILWWIPGDTADAWAWTIEPKMTTIFMGSGYAAGAFFFLPGPPPRPLAPRLRRRPLRRELRQPDARRDPAPLGPLQPGDAPFVGAFVFYGWVAVYIVSPAIVYRLWLRNESTDTRRPDARDAALPPAVLRAARGVGVATIQVASGALLRSRDPRWSTCRVLLQTFLLASVLMLIGAARAWSDFDHGNPISWLFVAGLAVMATSIVVLYRQTEAIAAGPTPSPAI